jgi:hypothetical protein
MKGKRVQFDDETWLALDGLSRDSKRAFQELADEAFADLLNKHGRPKTLKEALLESARREPANDRKPAARKRGGGTRP